MCHAFLLDCVKCDSIEEVKQVCPTKDKIIEKGREEETMNEMTTEHDGNESET